MKYYAVNKYGNGDTDVVLGLFYLKYSIFKWVQVESCIVNDVRNNRKAVSAVTQPGHMEVEWISFLMRFPQESIIVSSCYRALWTSDSSSVLSIFCSRSVSNRGDTAMSTGLISCGWAAQSLGTKHSDLGENAPQTLSQKQTMNLTAFYRGSL